MRGMLAAFVDVADVTTYRDIATRGGIDTAQ
jgi:hypothetical protein